MRKQPVQVLIAHLQSGYAMASQPALADRAQAQARAQVQVQITQGFSALDSYVKTPTVDRIGAVDQTLAVDLQQLLDQDLGMGLVLTQAALAVDQTLAVDLQHRLGLILGLGMGRLILTQAALAVD